MSAAVVLGGLIALFARPASVPIELSVGSLEPVEMETESGEPVFALPVTISTPGTWPKPNSAVFFEPGSTRAEARLPGASNAWVEAHCTMPADRISAGWAAAGTVLVTQQTEAIRLRLKCTGRSLPWRLAGFISQIGVHIPPKVLARLGPLPGRKPRWREVTVEISIPNKGATSLSCSF